MGCAACPIVEECIHAFSQALACQRGALGNGIRTDSQVLLYGTREDAQLNPIDLDTFSNIDLGGAPVGSACGSPLVLNETFALVCFVSDLVNRPAARARGCWFGIEVAKGDGTRVVLRLVSCSANECDVLNRAVICGAELGEANPDPASPRAKCNTPLKVSRTHWRRRD